MGSVTELFDTSPADTSSPTYIKDELRTNPQEGMMKIIHDTNAVNTSGIDLPDIAANTPINMTNDQRSRIVNIMAQTTAASGASIPSTAGTMQPPSSLSTILGSIPAPQVDLAAMKDSQEQIDKLQQLSENTAYGITELQSYLGPLSPLGHIPGVETEVLPHGSGDYFDYGQFINTDALGTTGNLGGQGLGPEDFFSLDTTQSGGGPGGYVSAQAVGGGQSAAPYEGGGHVFETGSASTPSETGTEEIPRGEFNLGGVGGGGGGVESAPPERETKRRKRA